MVMENDNLITKYLKISDKVKDLVTKIKKLERFPYKIVAKYDEIMSKLFEKTHKTAWSIRNFIFGEDLVPSPIELKRIREVREKIEQKNKLREEKLKEVYGEDEFD